MLRLVESHMESANATQHAPPAVRKCMTITPVLARRQDARHQLALSPAHRQQQAQPQLCNRAARTSAGPVAARAPPLLLSIPVTCSSRCNLSCAIVHHAPVLAWRQDARHQLAFKAVGEEAVAQVVAQPRHLWQGEGQGGGHQLLAGRECAQKAVAVGVAQRGAGIMPSMPSAWSLCTAAEQIAWQQHPPPAPQGRSRSAPAPAAWPPGAAQTPAWGAQWQAGEQAGSSTDGVSVGRQSFSSCLAARRSANSCRAAQEVGGSGTCHPVLGSSSSASSSSFATASRQHRAAPAALPLTSAVCNGSAPALVRSSRPAPDELQHEQELNAAARASPWLGAPRPASAQIACG